jgi:hypothetical protein
MTFSKQNPPPPAIAKTVAECAQEKTLLHANFFFSRGDGPLRTPRLTLAFRFAQSDSAFKQVQALILGDTELLSQFQELFLTPLLKTNPPRRSMLIILDALDKCGEKGAADILRLVFSHPISSIDYKCTHTYRRLEILGITIFTLRHRLFRPVLSSPSKPVFYRCKMHLDANTQIVTTEIQNNKGGETK